MRQQMLVASKVSVLASVPCTTSTLVQHAFDVDQYPDVSSPGRGLGASAACEPACKQHKLIYWMQIQWALAFLALH